LLVVTIKVHSMIKNSKDIASNQLISANIDTVVTI
jgi:hypothetical protein